MVALIVNFSVVVKTWIKCVLGIFSKKIVFLENISEVLKKLFTTKISSDLSASVVLNNCSKKA